MYSVDTYVFMTYKFGCVLRGGLKKKRTLHFGEVMYMLLEIMYCILAL